LKTGILIVEDEGVVAKDIQNTLSAMGYTVLGIANSGEEAIKLSGLLRPNLIIMDIMLLKDQMDGIEVVEKLKMLYDIPIIYLTAYSDTKTLNRAKVTEPQGYILKPFIPKELKIVIDMAIYKHRQEKKLRETAKWMSEILNNVGNAVIATDSKGVVTLANPIAESMIGLNSQEMKNKSISDFLYLVEENQRIPLVYSIQNASKNNLLVNLKDSILVSSQGNELPVDIMITPIANEENSNFGVVITLHDISEMKKENADLSEKMLGIEQEKRKLERYFPENLVDFLVDEGNEKELLGKNIEATMMFCDLRNSTGIAEELAPSDFVQFLNELLSGIMDLVYANGGSVNKLLGDGLLITFGCPIQDENDALNCVILSLQIRQYIIAYNTIKPDFIKDPVVVGVGIATGIVFAGNIGSVRHMDYTVLGDPVNTASRLEAMTKSIGYDILIDETTYLKVKSKINMEHLGEQEIRGKHKLSLLFCPTGII
jgi:PAS domain S-box-containing protein